MFPVLVVLAVVVSTEPVDGHRISCYYRYGQRNLYLDQATLRNVNCTHILVGFATVTSDFKVNLTDVGGLNGLRSLSEQIKLPRRRVMLSIGGGGGQSHFSQMVSRRSNTDTFLAALIDVVREASLDGVDYDWEFPGILQFDDFGRFLQRTRDAFDRLTEGKTQHLDLSVALPGPLTLTAGYNVDVLRKTCTFLNVMTYDLVLYSSWRPAAAFHNALYGQGNFLNPLRLFSVDVSMGNWVNLGIPAEMLLLGIPTYGVAYALTDKQKGSPLAAVSGYSHLGANIMYDQICELISANPEGNNFSEQSRVPYFHDGKNGTWVSYDNVRSVVEKTQFAVRKGYGGIMIFSLNADDPRGKCSLGCSQASEACQILPGDRSNGFPLSQVAIATLKDAAGKLG